MHAPGELTLGLHLVNSTNLDYFQPQHQAELFRLKGQFMQALGERDQANSNYSTALTIWDQLPDGWLSWGSHCDEMYESSGNHAWLEYAVSCYLQAVKHGSCAGRTMLPRVLHLLSFENDTGAVGRALDRKLNEVWVRVRAHSGLTVATWCRDALQSPLLFSVQLFCVAFHHLDSLPDRVTRTLR